MLAVGYSTTSATSFAPVRCERRQRMPGEPPKDSRSERAQLFSRSCRSQKPEPWGEKLAWWAVNRACETVADDAASSRPSACCPASAWVWASSSIRAAYSLLARRSDCSAMRCRALSAVAKPLYPVLLRRHRARPTISIKRWWGSKPRPADYEKYGPVHRTHYLHGYHGARPPMTLIALFAPMARSTNRSTAQRRSSPVLLRCSTAGQVRLPGVRQRRGGRRPH